MSLYPTTMSRRSLMTATTLGLAAGASPSLAAEDKPGLQSEYLLTIRAALSPPQDIGERQIFIVSGGEFTGPGLNGKVLPGGGDWALVDPEGVTKLDVRTSLETDDGALIYMHFEGRIQNVNGETYFRMTPYFETASEKYLWLNGIVSVGVQIPSLPGRVAYDVYRIL